MSKSEDKLQSSRRNFLVGAGGALAASGVAMRVNAAPEIAASNPPLDKDTEPFFGLHQGGIATPSQTQTYFAAFDLHTDKAEDVKALLRRWTEIAAKLSAEGVESCARGASG